MRLQFTKYSRIRLLLLVKSRQKNQRHNLSMQIDYSFSDLFKKTQGFTDQFVYKKLFLLKNKIFFYEKIITVCIGILQYTYDRIRTG